MIKVGYQETGRNIARVSVIIPVYNAEHYIRQAVESVMKQTFEDMIEIMIINDC